MGPAVAVGPVTRRRLPAQVRDLGAEPVGDLPDRLARPSLDRAAVEFEADVLGHARLRHRRSCGKCLSTLRLGLPAAWPSPQIDASRITAVRSSRSYRSQTPPARARKEAGGGETGSVRERAWGGSRNN